MKTGTKLHFTNIKDINDKKVEFFIGGALPYEKYDVSLLQQAFGVIYREYEEDDNGNQVVSKTYVLDKEDEKLFTSDIIIINNNKYKKILPVYNVYTLKQNLESRCTIIKGELPYNTQHGIPLKGTVQDVQLSMLKIINDTPGVQRCEVLSTKLINKKFVLEVKVTTNFGTFITTVG